MGFRARTDPRHHFGHRQGATEFIPVSSSGHLVIVPWLLGWKTTPMPGCSSTPCCIGAPWSPSFGSSGPIFWISSKPRCAASAAFAGRSECAHCLVHRAGNSIPAAVTGLLLKDQIELLFDSPRAAGFPLGDRGAVGRRRLLVRKVQQLRLMREMKLWDAIFIGLAQAIALAPGISRSGSTIAAGLVRKFRRDEAARFSFFLGTPAFLDAGLLQMADTLSTDAGQVTGNVLPLLAGFIASAVAGVIAIRFLLAYLRRRSLYVFALYCTVVGLAVIALTFVRP
ncbi:MAG: undecaprenyl-diphosphate phosphatase [Caldilineaceae bacterium]